MVALKQATDHGVLLPSQLVHGLRERSSKRLIRMASAPGKQGFGRTLFKRIVPLVEREKTVVEQAVSMSYLCCYFADHIVLAEMEATLTVENREMTAEEETDAWEEHYHTVITHLIPQVSDPDRLLRTIRKLDGYTELPSALHAARGRHWQSIQSLLSPTRRHRHSGHDPEAFLRNKICEVVGSRRTTPAKAKSICLAASLLADIHAWRRGADWHQSYAWVMIDLYPVLVDHPRVLDRLVNMN